MSVKLSKIIAGFAALGCAFCLAMVPSFARDEWFDDYETAVTALREGDGKAAVEALNRALKEKSDPGYHRTYGMNHIRYIPYFRLAEAHRVLGECEKAMYFIEQSRLMRELEQLPRETNRRSEIEEQCRSEVQAASISADGQQQRSDSADSEPASPQLPNRKPSLPDTTRQGIEAGVGAYLEGRYQEAVTALEQVLLEDADLPRVRVLLCSALFQKWVLEGKTDPAPMERIEAELRVSALENRSLELDSRIHPREIRKLYQGFSTENMTD